MSNLAAVSLLLSLLWAPLLFIGVRHRDWVTVGVVLWVWMVNAIIGSGEVTAGRLLSIPWVLTVVALLWERLAQSPAHVKHVAARQVDEARKMAHDRINDATAEFSRELARRRAAADERERALVLEVEDLRRRMRLDP